MHGTLLYTTYTTTDTVNVSQSACSVCAFGNAVVGWYGIPAGMMVTAPVRFEFPGQWEVVPDVELTANQTSQLKQIIKVDTPFAHDYLCEHHLSIQLFTYLESLLDYLMN